MLLLWLLLLLLLLLLVGNWVVAFYVDRNLIFADLVLYFFPARVPTTFLHHLLPALTTTIFSMALVSAKTIILFRSCFLWSLGYMLVMSPKKVSEHPLVLLIGQAMEIVGF